MTGATRDRANALRRLGLLPFASQDDIRAAWRKLAFETHPDRAEDRQDDFAEIREAYELLREHAPRPMSRPVSRPAMPTHTVELSPDVAVRCRALLATGATGTQIDLRGTHVARWIANVVEPGPDHVPVAIRRTGRTIIYLMRAPLEQGGNRVALPVGELEDPRNVRPVILTVVPGRPGPAEVAVPVEVVAALFPGARAVSLHFALP